MNNQPIRNREVMKSLQSSIDKKIAELEAESNREKLAQMVKLDYGRKVIMKALSKGERIIIERT